MRVFSNKQELQNKILNGANILTDNVASTLGPKGRPVILQEKNKNPFITKDGVTVAHFVELADPFENVGAQIIKQAAINTNADAGDGTTTSTVLSRAILRESQRFLDTGTSAVDLQRQITKATEDVVGKLQELVRPIRSIDDIEHIATISANNDSKIGKIIAMAVDKVGQDGSITIEEGRSISSSIDILEGFRFQSGFLSPNFITDDRRAISSYDEPLILVTDHKLDKLETILPLLEKVSRTQKPLLVVGEDIEGQVLASFIANASRAKAKIAGAMKVVAIKAPFYGEERREFLHDLSISVGATFISRESGMSLHNATLADLGSAKTFESTRFSTIIVGGKANQEKVETTIHSLKEQILQTDDFSYAEILQGRIVRLSSAVAVIKVGGTTEVEMIETKHRIEDALEAVRSAQDEGVTIGGGIALLRASRELDEKNPGGAVVKRSCEEPFRQMARNAGLNEHKLLDEVLSQDDKCAYDFFSNEMVDAFENGIIDPVKVTKIALQNASSCAGVLMTANYGIVQINE